MSYELLKHNINKNLKLSNTELDTVCKYFKPIALKKREFLLTQVADVNLKALY